MRRSRPGWSRRSTPRPAAAGVWARPGARPGRSSGSAEAGRRTAPPAPLARSLNPAQSRWISGYFAGLDAGLLRGGVAEPAPQAAPAGRTLTILYGTETGNARDLGKALAAAAAERGLAPRLFDMADYKVR